MSRLSNAPLQEVIFEARWALDTDQATGQEYDQKYSLAAGALKAHVQERFPHVDQRLPFHPLTQHLFARQAVLQFRKEPGASPLLQLGPGVFTVNDTDKNYDWQESYQPTLIYGLEMLEKAYDGTLPYEQVALRYIDSVKVKDYGFTDWASFISKHLRFGFANQFDHGMVPKDVSFQQLFDLPDDDQLHLQIGSGTDRDGDDRLIWQTTVQRKGSFDRAGLLAWGNTAHDLSSKLFKDFCQPDFHASFA
ncbi:MAG: TIGR04255 family protein [Flavobacteriales bacterium]|nr:TIGR04255 family protein [Flavobacteriales bacterium]